MFTEPSFEELLKRPNESFKILYINFKSEWLAYAKRFSVRDDVVIDVYQDAFLCFYENLLSGKIKTLNSSLKTYIFSIAKYKIYEHLRETSKLRLVKAEMTSKIGTKNLKLTDEPLTEREKLVKSSLKKLGKQCQQVLEMFYLRGLTLDDIKILENYQNTNTVKSQKSRCLRKLRSLVNRENE